MPTALTAPRHPFAGEMARARPTAIPGRYAATAGDYSVPIEYRGVRTLVVTFPAPLAMLRELLPAPVKPRRMYGAMGGLVVQLVDMPDTSIGAYNECVIGVVAEDSYRWPTRDDGFAWQSPACYALWLAVSSPLAIESGQAIWGYPKTLADTRWSVTREQFSATVVQDGRSILACEGIRPLDGERGAIHMRSLTHLDGALCRTSVQGTCNYALAEPGECALQLFPGAPISEALAHQRWDAPISVHYLWNYDYQLTAPLEAVAP